MSKDKKRKKKTEIFNYLVNLQQRNCLDSQTKGIIRNIGPD